MKQLPLPVRLRASSLFATYCRGPNGVVVSRLEALRTHERPISCWLFGAAGTGKSHLLQAVCAAAKTTSAYFPLGDPNLTPDVLYGCESVGYVCLDDVESAVGHSEWENAIFRLYTEFEESGGRLIIATQASPASIGFGLKDLASRLSSGLIFRLEPLSDEEQGTALAMRAQQLGLEIPPDVTQYLQRRLPRDMTTLCDTLDELDRASLAGQRKLTVPFVRASLGYQSE